MAGLHKLVVDFSACLAAIDGSAGDRVRPALSDTLVGDLRQVAGGLRTALLSTLDSFDRVVNAHNDNGTSESMRTRALRFSADLRRQLRSSEYRDQAEQARTELQKIAGKRGLDTAADHYKSHADQEQGLANTLRFLVAIVVALITAFALVTNLGRAPASFGAELLRLSVTLPFALFAAYLAHESSRHRREAAWARELSMALHTVAAYAQPLGERGTELRVALGQRVFAKASGPGQDPAPHDSLTIGEHLGDIARAVLPNSPDRKDPAQ